MALTKKELHAEVSKIIEEYGIQAEAGAQLLALVEPKRGGVKFDIDEIACREEDGTVTHILDSVLKVWIPVYDNEGEPTFYEKPDTELGWSRFTKVAEKLRKDAEKAYKASKDAILNDLLDGAIDQAAAKEAMDAAEAARHEYILPEGFEYSSERPCA